jgi:hypothetical protein
MHITTQDNEQLILIEMNMQCQYIPTPKQNKKSRFINIIYSFGNTSSSKMDCHKETKDHHHNLAFVLKTTLDYIFIDSFYIKNTLYCKNKSLLA